MTSAPSTAARLSTVFYDGSRQIVLTSTVTRSGGKPRRVYRAQILDGRTSPATLVTPDIAHDGTEHGAAAAAIAWLDAQHAAEK